MYSESDYESDVEFRRIRGQKTPTPVFTSSKAYEPPKWAPGPDFGEGRGRQSEEGKPGQDQIQTQTKVIRLDRQELELGGGPQVEDPGLAASAEFVTRMARQVEMERLEAASRLRDTKPLSPTLFVPAKFVPGAPAAHASLLADRALGHFAPESDDVHPSSANPTLERRS